MYVRDPKDGAALGERGQGRRCSSLVATYCVLVSCYVLWKDGEAAAGRRHKRRAARSSVGLKKEERKKEPAGLKNPQTRRAHCTSSLMTPKWMTRHAEQGQGRLPPLAGEDLQQANS